jgi:hypothetical protein
MACGLLNFIKRQHDDFTTIQGDEVRSRSRQPVQLGDYIGPSKRARYTALVELLAAVVVEHTTKEFN